MTNAINCCRKRLRFSLIPTSFYLRTFAARTRSAAMRAMDRSYEYE
jgi:hypothetical protein